MQRVSEACSLDDDMVDGDLGDGIGARAASSFTDKRSQSFASLSETLFRSNSHPGEQVWITGLRTTETQQRVRWAIPPCGNSLVNLSKDELRDRLQEASEVIDVLCSELDVAHRYLEGKYEALKILQGKAILDKATIHTKSLLQKCEEKAKALEKEVNSLQWELNFNQVQMKKSEQSWEQKHDRIANENKSLAESLQVRDSEIQQLRAENTALNRQCVELLSMLNVKEKRTYQETKPQYSQKGDASVLELAVLGACRCPGVVEVVEVCPCSRAAAASRRQLIELQQELDAQQSKREEAVMVADAFRIAFEQQLRRRSERLLLPAGANILKTNYNKAEGANRSPLMSVGQRLREFLPSSLELKMTDDLLEILYRLLDLLNDKEEALAHQRKVSIMLAHSAEELQRQLHLSSLYQPSERSEASIPSKLPQHQSQSENQPQEANETSEYKVQTKEHLKMPVCQLKLGELSCLTQSRTERQGPPDQTQTTVHQQSNHKNCVSEIQQPHQSES
ncbi:coiled-coil domain-containing protein 125 isoform X2 [Echeneis naucrates]|uniref:coiled-coil domain-containing protein 125 isoform X2 n=1 Tax=Echeneis naucrates TaxID=173247 RepID=UPI001113C59B|nr:coiled-coil domain-containing protein 125 isoform X2 [Echeneis naucrates]